MQSPQHTRSQTSKSRASCFDDVVFQIEYTEHIQGSHAAPDIFSLSYQIWSALSSTLSWPLEAHPCETPVGTLLGYMYAVQFVTVPTIP